MSNDAPLLSLRRISVSFGPVRALSTVDLDIAPGEIRAILGENGAGKSTLMNAIYGLVPLDAGEVEWRGEPVEIDSPLDARRIGIGMVHQEFALVDALTVSDNLALAVGGEGRLIDHGRVRQRANQRAKELGLEIGSLDAVVGELPVGVRQRIEILKAMLHPVDLLILDEPTAVLTPQEIEQLFAVVRSLKNRGVAVLLITHKLREVMELADSVTILRRGEAVAQRRPSNTTEDELAELMIGRALQPAENRVHGEKTGAHVLATEDLCLCNGRHAALQAVELSVACGEILGIAGVDGNGQEELFDVIAGTVAPNAGSVAIDGIPPHPHDRRTLSAAGVCVIPPDRRRGGSVLDMEVWENAILDYELLHRYSPRARLDRAAATDLATQIIDEYGIICDGTSAAAASLSGGNLQKLIVGRALARRPRLLIAFNPTRGLDVGAARGVHDALRGVAGWSGGVLLISTDLEEVMTLSDRIAVLYRGRLSPAAAPPFDRNRLGLLMGGADTSRAATEDAGRAIAPAR